MSGRAGKEKERRAEQTRALVLSAGYPARTIVRALFAVDWENDQALGDKRLDADRHARTKVRCYYVTNLALTAPICNIIRRGLYLTVTCRSS